VNATANALYERLRDVGFTRPYIRNVAALPTWWDDSLWDDGLGRAEGYIHLSRHLGIDIATLAEPSTTLRLKDFGICKYKKTAGTTEDELFLSRVIATRAAQLAVTAVSCSYERIPTASVIRNNILETNSTVGLESLVDFCWKSGVPVIHVSTFPSDAKKKPMGFTLRVEGRPAIVLCLNNNQPAKQLFILAHELGHVFHDHVPENGSLLDERVDGEGLDEEETSADQFAVELLNGRSGAAYTINGRWPKAETLAEVARGYGRQNHIDTGLVVLNTAHGIGGGFWPVANAALKLLDPAPNAIGSIRERLAANLDWDQLPEDSSEFLMRITGRELPA